MKRAGGRKPAPAAADFCCPRRTGRPALGGARPAPPCSAPPRPARRESRRLPGRVRSRRPPGGGGAGAGARPGPAGGQPRPRRAGSPRCAPRAAAAARLGARWAVLGGTGRSDSFLSPLPRRGTPVAPGCGTGVRLPPHRRRDARPAGDARGDPAFAGGLKAAGPPLHPAGGGGAGGRLPLAAGLGVPCSGQHALPGTGPGKGSEREHGEDSCSQVARLGGSTGKGTAVKLSAVSGKLPPLSQPEPARVERAGSGTGRPSREGTRVWH